MTVRYTTFDIVDQFRRGEISLMEATAKLGHGYRLWRKACRDAATDTHAGRSEFYTDEALLALRGNARAYRAAYRDVIASAQPLDQIPWTDMDDLNAMGDN